jgi:uncharacterized membrane protein
MISTTLMTWLGVASAAIVIVLVLRRPRRRLSDSVEAELANARNASFGSMLLSFAATIGLARAQADAARDAHAVGGFNWPGSHLSHHHHGGYDGGGFTDGGGYGGGDAGGGGAI